MVPFADAGLPMIFVEAQFLVLALIPVVLAEAAVYWWGLQLPWRKAISGSLVANLWSTFLGVPVSWFILLVTQLSVGGGAAWGLKTPLTRLAAVTVQAPWLIPYEESLYWMVPAASLFLMLPFFLASVGIEWLVLRRRWPTVDRGRLTRQVWLANLVSYGALAGFWLIDLIVAQPPPPFVD
jgi:hypothetical protein